MTPSTKAPAAERILDAAFRLFCERGIDATTTREIAHAAGVNEVTIFRNFGSKQGLTQAIFEQFIAKRILQEIEELELQRTGNLYRDLENLTRTIIRIHREREDVIRFTLANMPLHPEHVDPFRRSQQAMLERVSSFFAPFAHAIGLDPIAVTTDFVSTILMRTISRILAGFVYLEDETFITTHAALYARALALREGDAP